MGGLSKITQRHFLLRETATLSHQTAVICPKSSCHLSRMICIAIVCVSDSSERSTRLNVELVSLQRLEGEIWLYNEVCSMALMAAWDWSFGKIPVTVLVSLCPLPSGSQASQVTYELSSPTETAPTGNKQHSHDTGLRGTEETLESSGPYIWSCLAFP